MKWNGIKTHLRATTVVMAKYCMLPVGMIASSLCDKSYCPRIQVLLYHRVNDQVQQEIAVKMDEFWWQMEYLKKKGYQVISLEEALQVQSCRPVQREDDADQGRRSLPYIVLTFDDGYQDFINNALPVLEYFGYPATHYLVSDFIESDKVYWWDQDLGTSDLMDWNQVREMCASGLITIGSHTATHPDFNKIEDRELISQLRSSKEQLEAHLGIPIHHFSYPRGIVTDHSRAAVKFIYDSAVSIFDGYTLSERVSDIRDDVLYQIKRLPIQRSDNRLLFQARLRGWLVCEEWIKRYLIRY